MKLTLYEINLILCLSFTLSACSTTVVDELKVKPTLVMESDDSIVILGRRHVSRQETEVDYISCLGDNLSNGTAGLNVIPEQKFIDDMYPYFETSTAPLDVGNLDEMVQEPVIAQKFGDLNIRYLIWVDGNTERVDQNGGISCAIGPGGGGCFGLASWEDEANYQAKIWDLDELALSGKIRTETSGTSYMPAIIIPIPLLARVKADACDGMATQIKQFIQS